MVAVTYNRWPLAIVTIIVFAMVIVIIVLRY